MSRDDGERRTNRKFVRFLCVSYLLFSIASVDLGFGEFVQPMVNACSTGSSIFATCMSRFSIALVIAAMSHAGIK